MGGKFVISKLRDLLGERVNQIVNRGISIARRQWRKIKPGFQELQNGDGFVLPVVDLTLARQRRDDDSRNTNASTPAVASHRRRNVIPAATVFIISNNDCASVPNIAVLHSPDQDRKSTRLNSSHVAISY